MSSSVRVNRAYHRIRSSPSPAKSPSTAVAPTRDALMFATLVFHSYLIFDKKQGWNDIRENRLKVI